MKSLIIMFLTIILTIILTFNSFGAKLKDLGNGPTLGSKNTSFNYIKPTSATQTKLTKINTGPKYTSAGCRSTIRTYYRYSDITFTYISGSGVSRSYWE